MKLLQDEQLIPFRKLLDEYNNCFYKRNIEGLEQLYVEDDDLIYFDNHENCDSFNFSDHIKKVTNFFKTGTIVPLSYENLIVYQFDNSACMIVKIRYIDRPQPGVRASFFLDCHLV